MIFVMLGCTPDTGREPRDGTDPTSESASLSTTSATSSQPTGPIRINEVMARNDSTWVDPADGTLPDWIELVNVSDEPVDWSRISLADGGTGTWTGADGALVPGERVLLTATALGFGLDGDGDEVRVFLDGAAIDAVAWDGLGRDLALARTPDSDGAWETTAWPTPGEANGDTASPTADAADGTVFLSDRVHAIAFEVTQDQYDLLAEGSGFIGTFADYHEVEAAMTIDGFEYPAVGLRRKGSASADPLSGKPPFKVDLNEWIPGTRFRSLKGFNLDNGKVYDPTLIHAWLSYRLANESDVAAPRVGWATVSLNGLDYGIYALVEQPDEVWIERFFPGAGERGVVIEPNETSDGGFLTTGDFGIGAMNWDYEQGPSPADPAMMAVLEGVDDLVRGPASDAAVAELWTLADEERVLTYLAWENVVGHLDGYHAVNNWRIYVDPDTRLMQLMPAGADWTWEESADPWQWGGALAMWCFDNAGCAEGVAERMVDVADRVGELDMLGDFDRIYNGIEPLLFSQPRSNHTDTTINRSHDNTRDNIVDLPAQARAAACSRYPSACTP